MTREEIDKILSELKWEVWPYRPYGGQQVNTYPRGVKVYHPDLSVQVCMSEMRTQMDNQKVAREMFELFLLNVK